MKSPFILFLAGLLLIGTFKSYGQSSISGCPQNIISCNPVVSWTPPTFNTTLGYTANSNYAPGATFPAGTTTVTYTFADATPGSPYTCSFTVTVTLPATTITVTPANNVFTGGTPEQIFLGYGPQSVSLTATPASGSFLWSSTGAGLSCTNCSTAVFTPTTAGNYLINLTVISSPVCTATYSKTICVTDVRAPGNKVYVCRSLGNSGKTQTQSFPANAVANHLSNGAVLGSCSQPLCGAAKESATANLVLSSDNDLEIIAQPNPFRNEMRVRMHSLSLESGDLTIYDLTGRVLERKPAQSISSDVVIGKELPAGLYILEARNGDSVAKIKIMKQ